MPRNSCVEFEIARHGARSRPVVACRMSTQQALPVNSVRRGTFNDHLLENWPLGSEVS